MAKVTVIMPSLNVKKYIGSCMDSVLNQTLSDLEILAIDAGSTDGTAEILSEYAKKDLRVRVIHSEYKSYGYQINLGIREATGEYVGIVETDDFIERDMFEMLYKEAVKHSADFVKGTAKQFMELANGTMWTEKIASPIENIAELNCPIDTSQLPEILVKDIFLWTGIYRLDFIKQIVLNETKGAAFQDQGFLFQTLTQAKKAVYIDHIGYYYRQDNGNSSIYNRNGFHYIVEEYKYIKNHYLHSVDTKWQGAYYQRMTNQTMARMRYMALSGEFWKETIEDIECVRMQLKVALESGILTDKYMNDDQYRLLQLFVQSPEQVFEYYREYYDTKESQYQKLIETLGCNKVVLFGCTLQEKSIHLYLDKKSKADIVAICDNDKNKWGKQIQGLQVISPEAATNQYKDAMYLILSTKYHTEIEAQLRKQGVASDNIAVIPGGIDLQLLHKK